MTEVYERESEKKNYENQPQKKRRKTFKIEQTQSEC